VGSEEGELSFQQLQDAFASLGYHLDDATLALIFHGVHEEDHASHSLNVHEFLATVAILHMLDKVGGPSDPGEWSAVCSWMNTRRRSSNREAARARHALLSVPLTRLFIAQARQPCCAFAAPPACRRAVPGASC
jgi:hypothetical protein